MTPPVLAISGAQELLRIRCLKRTIKEQEDKGWDVQRVDGSDKGAVDTALCPQVFSTSSKALVVLDHPERVSLDLLQSQSQMKDPDTVLLLHYPGTPRANTKFATFLKGLGSKHKHFPLPEKWNVAKEAAIFCIDESRAYGKTLDPSLAAGLVALVGGNLGVLAFEVQKICLLADVEGASTLGVDHVKGGAAPLAEATLNPVISALSQRDRRRLLVALQRVQRTWRRDPTIPVCRFLGAVSLSWFGCSSLAEEGITGEEAARRLHMVPWYYSNQVAPYARLWPSADLKKLVNVLAESERGVLNGHLDPWVGLTARLLSVCGGALAS